MPQRPGLGKGLGALIQSTDEQPSPASHSEGITQAPTDKIKANPHQPRTSFDPDDLKELADSIREHGVIQPLILSRSPQSGRYALIAGERRMMAARQAGLFTVPAIVREASEQQQDESENKLAYAHDQKFPPKSEIMVDHGPPIVCKTP